MLVDNKFIFLSLPRCASTAFNFSCILNDIKIETFNGGWEIFNENIDFKKIDKTKLMDYIYHGHESLYDLQSKFGYNYPIISIKRNRYERFYSLYKHILFDLKRLGYDDVYDIFSKFTSKDLFFFNKENIISKKSRWEIICDYLIDLKVLEERIDVSVTSKFAISKEKYTEIDQKKSYLVNIIDILITPLSYWTHNNPKIIWFDFDEMDKLENWVSKKIERPFKLYSVNSSRHMDCQIILDDDFKKKYESIYNYYDLPKISKTFL